jgi:hypothetical protein
MADGGGMENTLRLCEATLTDLDLLARDMRTDEIEQVVAVTGEPFHPTDAAFMFAQLGGPRWTLADARGLPIACFGVEPRQAGAGRAWMIASRKGWEQHGWRMTRVVRKTLDALLVEDFERIEVMALATRWGARDWYERGLGMTFEGYHKKWIRGHDFVTFAKVRN